MNAAEKSGIVFTADPLTGQRDHLVVEAIRGPGEARVAGGVQPDTYVVSTDPIRIRSVTVGHRTSEMSCDTTAAESDASPYPDFDEQRVLTGEEILEVARLGLAEAQRCGTPQEIGWAYTDGAVWLVRSRSLSCPRRRGAR